MNSILWGMDALFNLVYPDRVPLARCINTLCVLAVGLAEHSEEHDNKNQEQRRSSQLDYKDISRLWFQLTLRERRTQWQWLKDRVLMGEKVARVAVIMRFCYTKRAHERVWKHVAVDMLSPTPCLVLVPSDRLLFMPEPIAISPSLTSMFASNYIAHDL